MKKICWRLVFFWVVLFYLVYTSRTEGAPKPVTLTVSPVRVVTNGGFAEVRVKWHIESHRDNARYSFTVTSSNLLDYKTVYGETRRGVNSAEELYTVRAGFYAFEACVYRRPVKKPSYRLCDKKFVEVR